MGTGRWTDEFIWRGVYEDVVDMGYLVSSRCWHLDLQLRGFRRGGAIWGHDHNCCVKLMDHM